MPHPGELAALAVSLLWSVGTLLFAWSATRIGPDATNLIRITLAALFLALLLTWTAGSPFPYWVPAPALAAFAVSGLLGLVVGDGCYFRSLALIGPRRATLLAALAPAFTAALGRIFLGESLGPRALAGMALTLAGTAWVVAERTAGVVAPGRPLAGVLWGLGAAFGQAAGLVLAKGAMTGVDPLATAAARMAAGTLGVWVLAALGGRLRADLARVREPAVLGRLALAALVGPTFGVWLSLYAAKHTETAVAATLMALVPIFILPLVRIVHGERITARAVCGALLAVGGVALLVSRR